MLVDDDLRFEDGPAAPRPAVMVNRWLRELPASGAPAPSSWENYARAVKEWTEFLAGHGVGLFDSRERLKSGLSRYAEHRAAGPVTARFAATTWGQHMSILSLFYRWAMDGGLCGGRAVHLPVRAGAVRRDRPGGPGEPGGPPHPEAARDHQVPGAGFH